MNDPLQLALMSTLPIDEVFGSRLKMFFKHGMEGISPTPIILLCDSIEPNVSL